MAYKTVKYTVRISENQSKTLTILKEKYNVNTSWFIREAIAEKLQREKIDIKESVKRSDVPF